MEKIPNRFYRISVKALILNEKKEFLFTKEENGMFEFPGGGLDHGEDPRICLEREIDEEMGLKVIEMADQPSYFLTTQHNVTRNWVANVLYETKLNSFEFIPSEECVAIEFHSVESARKIEDKLYPNVRKFLDLYNA